MFPIFSTRTWVPLFRRAGVAEPIPGTMVDAALASLIENLLERIENLEKEKDAQA